MRVLVLNIYKEFDFRYWKPEGDYEVLAETKELYKIKRIKKNVLGQNEDAVQWVPKWGPHTRCEVVKGWANVK